MVWAPALLLATRCCQCCQPRDPTWRPSWVGCTQVFSQHQHQPDYQQMFIVHLENTPYQWLSLLWYRIRPVSSICGHWSSEWPVWLLLLKETFILLIKFSFHYWWSLWPAEVWAGSFFPTKELLGPTTSSSTSHHHRPVPSAALIKFITKVEDGEGRTFLISMQWTPSTSLLGDTLLLFRESICYVCYWLLPGRSSCLLAD